MRRMRIIDNPEYFGGGIFYREHEKYMRDPELREAFECGRKEGWREAMREAEREGFGERRWREMPPMYRDNMGWREEEDMREYDERRRRRANGQYY